MYILMNCLGMPFNGETVLKGKSLGGSETSAYYMAKELVKLGHKVTIFTNSKERGKFDGVNYEWCGEITQKTPLGHIYNIVSQVPHDVCICQRHPLSFANNPNSKLNIWWLHDLALLRNIHYVNQHLPFIDMIFSVSKFHKDQISKVYDIAEEFIYPTTNGIDYSLIPRWENNIIREEKSLLFAARPERGLIDLVKPGGIMEYLQDYKLYVCGYDNTTANMANLYHQLWQRCEAMPNVTNLGPLGKRELYRKMCECEAYVYPTFFEDTSCILAMEAQACGLPWLSFKTGALPETLDNGGYHFFSNKCKTKEHTINCQEVAQNIKQIFNNGSIKNLREKAKNINYNYANIAEDWSKLFENKIACKSKKSLPNLIRHLEKNSDIIALKKLGVDEKSFPHLKYYDFAFSDNTALNDHYKAYYEYEKNRGVNYGPEDLSNQKRFEMVYNIISKMKTKMVLDYGCAHGHYTINLAKRLADTKFIGVDLVESNIAIAKKWMNDEKIENTLFATTNEEYWQKIKYDVIIAGEVLEHVVDYQALIKKLKGSLTPDGYIIITTPYGPWEAIGYDEHVGWRAHLHHFERADLDEVFGKQKEFKLLAIPSSRELGHYIVQFKNSSIPIDDINYNRKLASQSPKESVSLCIIAKNEEDTLSRQCKKMRKYVDEIIIGVDKTSTDDTLQVAKKFGDKVIEIDSPAGDNGIGFDAARNITIEQATCDWILWLDCDESLESPELMQIYTRANCYNGYYIPQHHYSADPPAIIKTDYPVRLFRNNKDIKFFGFVHEHPEIELNKGIGKTIFIGGISIMHTGYSTENVRRKRFMRNFPLMEKEMKLHPERFLSKFLFLRDLGNLMIYNIETYGDSKRLQNIEYAQTIIKLWQELLKSQKTRMVYDGLPYYSRAVEYLEKGIKIKCNMSTGSINSNMINARPIEGIFENRDILSQLIGLTIDEHYKHFEEKYY